MKLIIFLFIIDLFFFSNLCAQDKKSKRFKEMLESTMENDSIAPYDVYLVSDTVFSPDERRRMRSAFRARDQLTQGFRDLVKDEYFAKFVKGSSSSYVCGYYVESNPAFFSSYALFVKKRRLVVGKVKRLLRKDADLINIKVYIIPTEFIVLNEFFSYDHVFQPKTIDDFRLKKNITPLCVLCGSKENHINLSSPRIGFLESRHLTLICCPIVSNGEYLGDVLFTYLR